jgi:lipoprotein-releasing system permease protein
VSIISRISVVGIAVCTAAMVILLSAFNGIEQMISKLYTSFDAPITIQHQSRKTYFLRQIDFEKLQAINGVEAFSKELEELVVLRKNQRWINANMHAVDAEFMKRAKVSQHLINAVGADVLNNPGYVFLGADVFSKLKLGLGSEQNNIQMYAPKSNMKMKLGKMPFHIQPIDVAGALNYNQELNSNSLLWDYNAASQLFNQEGAITRIHIYTNANMDLQAIQNSIKKLVGPNFLVRTQLEKNELIYKTSRSERLVVFIILLFVFVLASFNLIATLTMLINEKQANLQILKALGMTSQNRFQIFFFEGLLLSFLGISLGLIFGLFICWCQQYFGWLIVPGANVPFPIVFKAKDFISILFASSTLAFIFTYFPVRFLMRRTQ